LSQEKEDIMDRVYILLKVALNTITLTLALENVIFATSQ
jgi:hypothetical protein